MALIGKIRKNSWLLVVMIGLGLGGFILMDMMTGSNGPVGANAQLMVGTINGEKIDRTEFERSYSLLYANSAGNSFANRDQLWNYYVEESLIGAEAEEVGLAVDREELIDLQFGANPSPIIAQRFPNPNQPGTVNREQLSRIQQVIQSNDIEGAIQRGELSPAFVPYWQFQEKEIIKSRLQAKLTNLVTKAIYTPTWMAEMIGKDQGRSLDLAYVRIPFDAIADDEVSVSDDELQDYLEENRARYERDEEGRVIDYVVFPVSPTAADSVAIRQQMTTLAGEFRNARNDSSFVLRNEGIISPAYVSAENINPAIADTVFSMNKGEVFGPYMEGSAYKLVKVLDRVNMADSADTRHILIQAQTPLQFPQAKQTIDSLENLIATGQAEFEALASQFSQDGGSSANGGLYENVVPGQFVPEYDEVIFRTGQLNKLYKIRTAYGWHLVEVLSRSSNTKPRVKVAYLVEPIIPTKETQDEMFRKASEFLAQYNSQEELVKAARADQNLRVESSNPVSINEFTVGGLAPGQESRDMICWAYNASEGEVSPAVYTFTDETAYYDNQYVVAALRSVVDEGLPAVDAVRDELTAAVIKRKKADMIKQQLSGSQDLQSIAARYNSAVDTLEQINFTQSFVNGLGTEPKVISEAFALATNAVSAPIAGNTGVFVIKPLTAPAENVTGNVQVVRQQQAAAQRALIAGSLLQGLRNEAEIEDNRAAYECSNP